MKGHRFQARALFFLPLLGAFLFIPQPDSPLPPLLLLGLALSYSRIAAFIEGQRGMEEMLLGLSSLPFGLAGAGFYGASGGPLLFALSAEAILFYATLVLLERLFIPRYRGFSLPLGFLLLLGAGLFAASLLPPVLVLGFEGLILGISGYAYLRRRQ